MVQNVLVNYLLNLLCPVSNILFRGQIKSSNTWTYFEKDSLKCYGKSIILDKEGSESRYAKYRCRKDGSALIKSMQIDLTPFRGMHNEACEPVRRVIMCITSEL